MNEQEFADTLVKYRYEPASVLYFAPPIERLIDSAYCRQLADVLHGDLLRWERLKAVPSLHDSLPDVKGLYMFVWRPEFVFKFGEPPVEERLSWVLYVGKAGIDAGTHDTIRQRYRSEYSKHVGQDASRLWLQNSPENRRDRLARYLTLRPLEFWFIEMQNVADIKRFEMKLLQVLRPPLNTQHVNYLRPGNRYRRRGILL